SRILVMTRFCHARGRSGIQVPGMGIMDTLPAAVRPLIPQLRDGYYNKGACLCKSWMDTFASNQRGLPHS
ncbi:MAG: hypothetical protein P8048_04775, partial [Calditrichia bacterium]